MDVVTICGAVFGILISAHLFHIRNNRAAQALGIYLMSISILLLEPVMDERIISEKITAILLSTSSLLVGPALFVYCNLSLNRSVSLWHFLPALILFILILFTPATDFTQNESPGELLLYGMFTVQLFAYTFLSLRLVFRWREGTEMSGRMTYAFVRMLTSASLGLFSFSFLSTIAGLNKGNIFVAIVQILLTVIIVIIALVNTEGLERRPKHEWISKSGTQF